MRLPKTSWMWVALAAAALALVFVAAALYSMTSSDSDGDTARDLPNDTPTAAAPMTAPPRQTPKKETPTVLAPPNYPFVNIEGRQVELLHGMLYTDGSPSDTSGIGGLLFYDSDPSQIGDSWLRFDLERRIDGCHIRVEDRETMSAFLAGVAFVPPCSTPSVP